MKRTGSIGFARAAGADDDVAAGQVGLARRLDESAGAQRHPGLGPGAIADGRHDRIDDAPAARRAAHARLAGGQLAGLGLDDRVTEVVAQPRDVVAGRRVRPHVAVHRRRDDHRRARRERRRGHDVAGQPAGHGAQPVRGRRGDDDRVGGVGDDDVADPPVGQQREDVGLDGVARQRLRTSAGRRTRSPPG